MLLALAITPIVFGLIVVFMAAAKKLRPQSVMERVETERGTERPEVAIQSDIERKKVSLKI